MPYEQKPSFVKLCTLFPQKKDPNKFSGKLGDSAVVLGRFRRTKGDMEVLDLVLMSVAQGNVHRAREDEPRAPSRSSAPPPKDPPNSRYPEADGFEPDGW